jgi:uncharacterized membrane protein
MPAIRIPVFGLLWTGLAVAYVVASALGLRPAALAVLGLAAGVLVAATGRRLAGLVVGIALAAAAWRFADAIAFLVFVPPLCAFAFMALLFASTLRAGSEPLISRIARKEHPDETPEVARYTRGLTGLWSASFAALFVAAVALATFLPVASWSRWISGLGFFVPVTLFLGEHAYRRHRFPDRERGSLAVLIPNVIAVFRDIVSETGRRLLPEAESR